MMSQHCFVGESSCHKIYFPGGVLRLSLSVCLINFFSQPSISSVFLPDKGYIVFLQLCMLPHIKEV